MHGLMDLVRLQPATIATLVVLQIFPQVLENNIFPFSLQNYFLRNRLIVYLRGQKIMNDNSAFSCLSGLLFFMINFVLCSFYRAIAWGSRSYSWNVS